MAQKCLALAVPKDKLFAFKLEVMQSSCPEVQPTDTPGEDTSPVAPLPSRPLSPFPQHITSVLSRSAQLDSYPATI
jgi:hypothetical protein